MKLAAVVAALLLAPLAAHADVSVIDNNKTLTVDCAKDANVSLMGNHISVTLTGTCAKVQIMGNHATVVGSVTALQVAGNNNTATLDAVDAIMVSGNNNTVSYKKGATKKAPSVANPGKDNKVTQVK